MVQPNTLNTHTFSTSNVEPWSPWYENHGSIMAEPWYHHLTWYNHGGTMLNKPRFNHGHTMVPWWLCDFCYGTLILVNLDKSPEVDENLSKNGFRINNRLFYLHTIMKSCSGQKLLAAHVTLLDGSPRGMGWEKTILFAVIWEGRFDAAVAKLL